MLSTNASFHASLQLPPPLCFTSPSTLLPSACSSSQHLRWARLSWHPIGGPLFQHIYKNHDYALKSRKEKIYINMLFEGGDEIHLRSSSRTLYPPPSRSGLLSQLQPPRCRRHPWRRPLTSPVSLLAVLAECLVLRSEEVMTLPELSVVARRGGRHSQVGTKTPYSAELKLCQKENRGCGGIKQ